MRSLNIIKPERPIIEMKCVDCKHQGDEELFINNNYKTDGRGYYVCPKCGSKNSQMAKPWPEINREIKEFEAQKKKEVIDSMFLCESVQRTTNFPELARKAVLGVGIRYDANRYWWIWDPNEYKWIEADEIDVMNAIDRRIYKSENTIEPYIRNTLIEALKREARTINPAVPDWHFIQFKENLYDFRSNYVENAAKEKFIRNPIPWSVGYSNKTPILDGLLQEWIGEGNNINTLKDLFAWIIVPYYFISSVPFIYGNGSDGKSQFIQLLFKFIGILNATTTTLNYIEKSQFGTYSLRNKLLAVITELPKNEIDQFTNIKAISGRDAIHLEKKGHDRVMETVYAKIMIVGNDVPICSDMSDGFARRIHLIHFPNQFEESGDVYTKVPDEEFENLARWCLNRLPELEKTHKLTGDEFDIKTKKSKYINTANQVNVFLQNGPIIRTKDSNDKLAVCEIHATYNEWADSQNKSIIAYNEFKAKLSNAGVQCETGYIDDKEGNRLHRLLAYGVKIRPEKGSEENAKDSKKAKDSKIDPKTDPNQGRL